MKKLSRFSNKFPGMVGDVHGAYVRFDDAMEALAELQTAIDALTKGAAPLHVDTRERQQLK